MRKAEKKRTKEAGKEFNSQVKSGQEPEEIINSSSNSTYFMSQDAFNNTGEIKNKSGDNVQVINREAKGLVRDSHKNMIEW